MHCILIFEGLDGVGLQLLPHVLHAVVRRLAVLGLHGFCILARGATGAEHSGASNWLLVKMHNQWSVQMCTADEVMHRLHAVGQQCLLHQVHRAVTAGSCRSVHARPPGPALSTYCLPIHLLLLFFLC